jgi:wobble nucleotide-excising tRNase
MIKKFKSVSGIHGLSDFNWTADDLQKYSLFYGWNGSGKTTLSNILYCLQQKKIAIEDYQDVEYKVEILPQSIISNNEVSSHSLSLAVFNQSYIDANIHFDNSGTEPITMIGEENIKLLEEIESDQKELDQKSELLGKKNSELRKLPETDPILTRAAQLWRGMASELSVSGDRYFGSGFNISSVRDLIEKSELTEDNLDNQVIQAEDESNRKQAVKKDWSSIEKPTNFEKHDYEELYSRANELLSTVVKVTKLPDIEALDHIFQNWVEQGVPLHSGTGTCAFCQNPLSKQRLDSLKQQFTDALTDKNSEIDNLVLEISRLEIDRISVDSNLLMPELREDFAENKQKSETPISELNKALESLRDDLEDKKQNLTNNQKSYQLHKYPKDTVDKVNETENALVSIIDSHNTKFENQEEETTEHLKVLMMSCVANHMKAEAYFTKTKNRADLLEEVGVLQKEVASDSSALEAKKGKLNDQEIAIDKINGVLSNFFSNNKLCFKPLVVDDITTYEIRRYGKTAKNLSEGEKSIIALAHFLVSLKGKTMGDIANTVVVIDDPVDSQDGNFLFRTYGVIKRTLKDAKQILILTHNFEFFNIVRDWFVNSDNDPTLLLISRENVDESNEKMIVSKLPSLLKDYKTEYHYLFFKLFEYLYGEDKVDAPLVANIARKVLEYFSSFKWCCKDSEDFASRIQVRFLGEDSTPEERAVGDAVYKFVNEYSHAKDPFRPIGIAEQEASEIAKNTLKFIEIADDDHFKSLKKQCNQGLQN